MAHVDDGTLNALLDGELREADATAIRTHLATCAECSVRFEEAKRFLTAADDLLGLLTVPVVKERPAAAARDATLVSVPSPVPPAVPAVPGAPEAAGAPPRRVSRTAKEVAVDLDGATHQSPAILPNVAREGEAVPRPRSPSSGNELRPLFEGRPSRSAPLPPRRPDWATLAWAASVVLALGVGYLADEVRHSKSSPSDLPQTLAAATDTGSRPASRPALRPAPSAVTRRVAPSGKAAADAFAAATPPAAKPRGATSRKAVQPAAAGAATPTALASGGGPAGNAGYRAGAAAAPAQPDLNQPAPPLIAQAPPARGREPADAAQRAGAGPQPRAAEAAGMIAAAPAAAPAAPRAAVTAPLTRLSARPAFRLSDVDAAAARLAGTMRTMEGLTIDNVKIGPGALVPGAQPDRDVVRIAYADPQGRRLQLDQQRLPPARDTSRDARARAVPAVLGLTYGDTVTTAGPGNATRVRWLDPAGLWLSLSGSMPADSLRALLARVR